MKMTEMFGVIGLGLLYILPMENSAQNSQINFEKGAFKEIKENDYDLSISKYREIEYEEVQYEKPEVIKTKILELENKICKTLEELEI